MKFLETLECLTISSLQHLFSQITQVWIPFIVCSNPLIHWGSIKCHQSPFLFCSYFSVFAAFTEKRYTAKGSVVSWLLLRSILIAASLKARHVPFTVLIPICVIDFESGRSAIVELQQSILPPTPTEILRRANLQTDANQHQLKLPVNTADEGRADASPGVIAEQHFEQRASQ